MTMANTGHIIINMTDQPVGKSERMKNNMISRYSVKKPYTVVVAIVLVIILGAVSLGKMNTDLFPSMNLPYAIVVTSYSGASPETVEMVVTKPVEQSMATVTDIENVSSVSSESVSMVILQFQETTDMDSATIEIREKLDQISGYWNESVGKPMIMKMNPDMMPVMIAAVEIDDMDATEVTDYTLNKIQPEIESVAGVASVSTTGNITESVEVLLKEEKIKDVNKEVMKALDRQFEEKEKELDDAVLDLKDSKEELESGKDELEAGKNEMAAGIAQGEQQLEQAEARITAGEEEINAQLAKLDQKQEELDKARTQLTEGRTQAEEGLAQLEQARSGIESLGQAIAALQEQETQLNQSAAAIQQAIREIDDQLAAFSPKEADFESEDEPFGFDEVFDDEEVQMPGIEDPNDPAQMLAVLQQQRAELVQQSEAVQAGLNELAASRTVLEEQLNQVVSSLNQNSPQEALDYISEQTTSIWNTLDELGDSEEQLNTAQAQLDAGRAKLEEAKEQIASGRSQISAGKVQMTTQQILASIEMSVTEAKLDSGSVQLEQGESQLESGIDQLREAKKEAKNQADLSKIISSDMIKGILAGQNFSMPAGYLEEDNQKYLVRVGDKLEGTGNLEDLVILDLDMDGLDPIRLRDVAEITRQDDSDRVYARLNGNPGVMLIVEKQTGYSTGDVTDRIRQRLAQIEEEHSNIHFSILMDQGVYIDLVVDSVANNMIYGALLAVFILLLFMKDIRPTLVVAFSIPISVVTAVVLMYFSGITLNIISLSGLALGIGMLVDNSIVVIENIDRLRQLGVPAKKAAIEGAGQVAGAVAASTLTTVCVFAPIVFTEGITRQLFVDMGLTIAYSLLASLIVAMTLVPMMSAGLLKNTKPKQFKILDKVKNVYGVLLGGALRVKILVLFAAVALLIASAVLSFKKGAAFMPEMESTQATMTINPPKDSTFGEMAEYADAILEKIQDIEDINGIGAMAGGSGYSSMLGGGNDGSVSVYLLLNEERKYSGEELEKEILKRTSDTPCEVSVSTQSMDMSALGSSGIQIQIKGKELDELAAISKDIAKLVEETEGTQNVSDGLKDADQEFRVVVDKAKAMEYQLTVAQVYQKIQARLAEASSATTLSDSDKDLSVYVRDEKDEKLTGDELKNMTIEVTGADGETKKVKLSRIAKFEAAEGPQSITRDSQTRYMTVSAEIAAGYNIGLVGDAVKEKLKDYQLPKGYSVEMTGEDETIADAMGQLYLMLTLALVFMYLIMVAQFQSLLSPFIIMFTVPLAFTGGFMALLTADMEVSVIAMIGFVMLSGIIVNNGIVLVDYTNQLREEGMPKREALIKAGKDRLRPVIMTALTTILGLSTMAAGVGMGGDMVQPMAVVTIGGLIYGTILTLFVVPCIYDLLNRKKYKSAEELLEVTDAD